MFDLLAQKLLLEVAVLLPRGVAVEALVVRIVEIACESLVGVYSRDPRRCKSSRRAGSSKLEISKDLCASE